jgi:hypothetical protein
MAGTSSVRQVLEARFSELLSELEDAVDLEIGSRLAVQVEGRLERAVAQAAAEAEERSRRVFASQLNQAVRRLRQASNVESLVATLLDVASPFSHSAAIFSIHGAGVRGEGVRGVSNEAAEVFGGLEVQLGEAPALAEAIRSLDPVTAAATPAQISAGPARLAAHEGDGRLSIFPLVVSGRAPALLLAWGAVQAPALEMLAQVAASCWAALPRAASDSQELVNIAIPETAPAQSQPNPNSGWDTLSHEEQRTHLRAQRFARVRVAEMRLFEPGAVQEGRAQRDLYSKLRKPIDAARLAFHESFFASCPSMVDYLHLELAQTLAHNERELLGNDYPGPMV